MITCRVCERRIRVAAVEEYDAPTQTMKYTCKPCDRFFKRLVAAPGETRALLATDPARPGHVAHTCIRSGQPIYLGRGWKARFDCPVPGCGRHTYQALNFLGGRQVVCDGRVFTKVTR